jgi:hypothetical protein
MFEKLRQHLNPATAIAFIALIFAVTGVSFAATGAGNGNGGGGGNKNNNSSLVASTAKSKGKTGPRGARGPAGPAGKNGTNGTNGAAGATGPQGPAGANGTNGTNGEKGEQGEKGKPGKAGEAGAPGEPGEPGVIHGQEPLPKGATETGAFTTQHGEAAESHEFTAISFPILLPAPITLTGGKHTFYVTAEEQTNKSQPACPGNAEAPQAAEGFLCVYQGFTEDPEGNPGEFGTFGVLISNPGHSGKSTSTAGVTGATLNVNYEGPAAEHFLSGTWAVTAE